MRKVSFCILIVLLTVSCARSAKHDGLLIAVSIPPQAWFVSQIAGDKADVLILVGPNQNHHNYEPTPKQIQSLAAADAWILCGTEFEISLKPKVASLFPSLPVVDGTEGVHFRVLEEYDDNDHNDNHPENDHTHSSLEIDRHTWLGREPAKILAAHIKNTFISIDNANEEYYSERYNDVVRMIDDEFDNLKEKLAPLKGKTVFVYHPSFGYFLDEFDIVQKAVEAGGKEPGPRGLNKLVERINEEKASGNWVGAVFVQSQFPVVAAKTLADSTGAQLIELDPLAQDWLENIRRMGDILLNHER